MGKLLQRLSDASRSGVYRAPRADGRPLAYVCRQGLCALPVDSPEALERELL
jgi:uncharacterized protein YyaL (SSP411 family)